MSKVEEQLVRIIGQYFELSRELNRVAIGEDSIPLEEYEDKYKQLRAIKNFFGEGTSWNLIEKQAPEKWISEARRDQDFKRYYRLRSEYDRLEVLIK